MHKVEWTHYWKTCCHFVCDQCIISKIHKNHIINKTEGRSQSNTTAKENTKNIEIKQLQNSWIKEYRDEDATFNRMYNALNRVSSYELQNEWIWEQAFKPFYDKLDKLKSNFKQKINNINNAKTHMLYSKMDKHIEYMNNLSSFINNAKESEFHKVAQTLEEASSLREVSEVSMQKLRQEIQKSELLTKDLLYREFYTYSFQSKNNTVNYITKMNKDSESKISVRKNDLNTAASIFIAIIDKVDSEWYWRVELEKNSVWKLSENSIIKITANKDPVKIDQLNLIESLRINDDKAEFNFELILLKIDNSLSSYIEKTEKQILNELILNQRQRENRLDETISEKSNKTK